MTTQTKKSWIAVSAILAFALSVFFGASSAQAHSDEFESTPENGSTVSQVNSITYVFAEPVEQAFPVELALKNDAEKTFELGAPTFNATGETMTVPITAGDLPNGSYTASYRATSADGHPFSGSITFTVSPDATPAPDEHTSATEDASGSAAEQNSPMPISLRMGEETNEFPIAIVLITAASVVGLALIITAVIVVVRRRNK